LGLIGQLPDDVHLDDGRSWCAGRLGDRDVCRGSGQAVDACEGGLPEGGLQELHRALWRLAADLDLDYPTLSALRGFRGL
jgi:hypothetical protein